MSRLVAVGNLVQAAVFGGLAAWLGGRWLPMTAVVGLAAALQLVAAGLVLAGRDRAVRLASALTVLVALLAVGLFAQAAVHTMVAYGPDATRQGRFALLGLAGALPWLVAWPGWQWLRGRRPGPEATQGAALLLVAGAVGSLPAVARALTTGPLERGPELTPEQGQQLAAAAFAAWTHGAPLPPGGPAATVLLTPWTAGRPGDTVQGEGADLAAAVGAALAQLPAPGARPALVLDLVVERWPAGTPLPPSQATVAGGRSPVVAVQSEEPAMRVQVLPEWHLPSARGSGERLRVDSFLAHEGGAARLANGWSPAPALDADAALASAVVAGDMLLHHQDGRGRYAYTVHGPSGEEGGGYNFPRHAGTTWFLARLAARTGEERFAAAADQGLAHLADNSDARPGGGRYVKDPRRKDGRAWAGTTALAALAAAERGHPAAAEWGAFLAASIDDRGAVRGEVIVDSGVFPEQQLNPYGQGQVTLALAALVRAGHDDLRPALERAAAFLDGGYAPGAARHLVVLDEHWSCLTASAIADVLGTPAGLDLCEGYLALRAAETPVPGQPLAIAAGPAGGLAEAVVAAAFLDPTGPHRAEALLFGQHFLDSQYRDHDTALLPRPDALLGGYRDRPWDLDVRMDAVQHIGCALLGIEALLRDERLPGSHP